MNDKLPIFLHLFLIALMVQCSIYQVLCAVHWFVFVGFTTVLVQRDCSDILFSWNAIYFHLGSQWKPLGCLPGNLTLLVTYWTATIGVGIVTWQCCKNDVVSARRFTKKKLKWKHQKQNFPTRLRKPAFLVGIRI
jgi:hypothetical protein